MSYAIIAGTGFYDLLDVLDPRSIETEYGVVDLFKGKIQGQEVYFLPRHGVKHGTLAPFVNYRANMMALKQVGVERIASISAVGSINPQIAIGSLSLLDQFVDFTRRRNKTYGKNSVDMTEPFCPELREVFIRSAKNVGLSLFPNATLICVDGPIYETRSELQLYGEWGMDVVGMTNATEALLARELGMCYSVVTLSTDLATGSAEVPPDLATHKMVASQNKQKINHLLSEFFTNMKEEYRCNCQQPYLQVIARQGGENK